MPEQIREINVSDCLPNPFERRQQDTNLDSLAASMESNGLLYPIIVRGRDWQKNVPQKFEIADGGRRMKAARALGWTEINAIVAELDDDDMQMYATVANLQREGLNMWEEIAEVQYLVERKTMTVPAIAEKLGKPISWVAKRYRVSQAEPKVIAWVKEEYPSITLDKLAELCLIDSVALLALIESDAVWRLTRGLDDLPLTKFKQVVGEYLMKLSTAPWKLDDETLVAAAGSCAACPHRSGRNPSLFDQLEPSEKIKKDERCLNPACWSAKQKAHTEIRLVAAREKYPNLRVVSDDYNSNAERTHSFEHCKKDDKGAFPAFHVDDRKAGQIEYLRPWNHASASEPKPPKSMATMTEKERTAARLATLEQKRQRVFVRLVRDAIDELRGTPKHSLALLLVFGSDESNNCAEDRDVWKDFTRFEKANDAAIDARAWEQVKDVISIRLNFMGTLEEVKPYYDDAVKFCEALELDQATFTAAAEKEVPTPKALQTVIVTINKHINPNARLQAAASAPPAKAAKKNKR